MRGNALTESRRRAGVGLLAVAALGSAWWLAPGLPVLWAPRAAASVRAAGLDLFRHEWQPRDPLAHGDGLGPVFNARSCAACHFQGGLGGGGDNEHNVLAFEAHPTRTRAGVAGGLIHKFAVADSFREDHEAIRRLFPIVPGGVRVVEGCTIVARDFDPVRTERVNSTALFGAGWIDRLAARSITHQDLRAALAAIGRELDGNFAGVPPGRYRVLPDGRVGKFGWKAQFATLEEFVAAACANEIGLGNPHMEQARPAMLARYPAVTPDLDAGQFRALVAFVDTLPRPTQAVPPGGPAGAAVARGEAIFSRVGCAICHVPELGGVAGLYSDFLLHKLDDTRGGGGRYGGDTPEVPLPREHPRPEEWKTSPLWGVADSAPYFHDGGSPTLEAAIERHRGDASAVAAAYRALPSDDRAALLAFLGSLKAPADAEPIERGPAESVAAK